MKVGAGGLNAQAVQDIMSMKQSEMARVKPLPGEDIQQGMQKLGQELNKPVLDMSNSAALTGYLRNKEASGNEKKRRTDEEPGKGPLSEKQGAQRKEKKTTYYETGSMLDEYK